MGSLRVIALGEITGVPGAHLDCECGLESCAKGGAARDESAETPADAADAQAWDDLLPEPVDADAPELEDVEPSSAPEPCAAQEVVDVEEPVVEPDVADPMDEPTCDEVPVAFGRALVVPGAPVLTVLKDPEGILVPRLQGYGPIDPDYAATLADVAKTIHYPESVRTAGPLIPQISDRPQAPPADPTGHGGHTVPPPGALTYAPSATLRAEVLANDAWCRYPYCGMPSHLCDLDHWRPFNHADPEAGGWTVLGDLIPLCRADHQRKHLAEWVPTLYTDRRVEWRNRRSGQVIVTYPR